MGEFQRSRAEFWASRDWLPGSADTSADSVALTGLRKTMPRRGQKLEARAGIEPAHRAFAELGLTTWLPRLNYLPLSTYSNIAG